MLRSCGDSSPMLRIMPPLAFIEVFDSRSSLTMMAVAGIDRCQRWAR